MRLRQLVLDVTMTDHFARLGLPRAFAVDPAELQRRYIAASRAVHPDLAGESSGHDSARVNEAYAVLRDPFRRADHLLTLLGGPGPSEVSQPPPAFLEEMLELRMAIAAAASPDDRVALAGQLKARRAELLDGLTRDFAAEPRDLAHIRRQLNALKFIDGLLRDLSEG